MSIKLYKPEQVVNLLRQIELEIANGKTTPQACQDEQITAQIYNRWRKEFGGLKSNMLITGGEEMIGQ